MRPAATAVLWQWQGVDQRQAWAFLAGVLVAMTVVLSLTVLMRRRTAVVSRRQQQSATRYRTLLAAGDTLMLLADPDAIAQRVVALLHTTAGFRSVRLRLLDGHDLVARALAGVPGGRDGDWLSVPIVADGQVIGRLDATAARPQDGSQQALLEVGARMAGVAFANARRCEAIRHAAALEERNRLARDLHDAVTQSIYSLTLLAEAGQRMIHQGEWGQIADNQARMADIAQQVLQEIRLKVYQLRPYAERPLGLVGALDQRLDAVERRAGIEAWLRVTGNDTLPGPLEEQLLLIAQEALNNALKYARATAVMVAIQFRETNVCLTIEDNGRGFEPLTIGHQGGMGLVGMQERAAQLGGELSIMSAPGRGTAVSVTAPYAGRKQPRLPAQEKVANARAK